MFHIQIWNRGSKGVKFYNIFIEFGSTTNNSQNTYINIEQTLYQLYVEYSGYNIISIYVTRSTQQQISPCSHL